MTGLKLSTNNSKHVAKIISDAGLLSKLQSNNKEMEIFIQRFREAMAVEGVD